MFNMLDKSSYPKFLITVLKECDRSYIKQSVCRMIIKFFGKKKKDDAAGPASGQDGDDSLKIEFITLVEPLVAIVSRPKENGVKLTALSIMSIVNMCNFSEDIKDIFF